MPYIICVNQPGCLPEADPTAVATIEEARDAACEELPEQHEIGAKAREQLVCDVQMLAELGGTIGPLPDGYVVEIVPVTWSELERLANSPTATRCTVPHEVADEQAVLDAYNQN